VTSGAFPHLKIQRGDNILRIPLGDQIEEAREFLKPARLKPCPKCGEVGELFVNDYENQWDMPVFVIDCPCGVRGPEKPSKELARLAWNEDWVGRTQKG
ncbi:MAG TPA: hypothetical protein VG944_03040, partial [Fimbriimonas sp.]|nr:hypothetical protein [Fimbriimonas sp.]